MWPGSLSGGQAQRVSLARALVSEPDLLLLDEPFSALDALTRIEMHALVTQLWERHGPAILLVTHDVDEALALADRVLVLDEGRVAREWQVHGASRGAHARAAPDRAAARAGARRPRCHVQPDRKWSSMTFPSIRPATRLTARPARRA